MPTVVAHQSAVGTVICQRNAASGTFRNRSALAAQNHPAVAAAIVLGVVFGVQLGKLRGDRDRLTKELCDMRNRASIPDFNSVFSIPKSATDEETELSPSREQFELAFFDALALTRSIFADLKNGSISRDKARSMILNLSVRARDDNTDIFSALPEGFLASGEMRALSILLENAAKGF